MDRLGGIHNLSITLISEASNAFAVLKGWCLEFLYGAHRGDDPRLLTTACQVVKLCFYLDKHNMLEHIGRSPLLAIFKGLPGFQRANGDSSVYFVAEFFHCLSTVDGMSVARGIASVK